MSANRYEAQLEAVARAAEAVSPTQFTWLGKPSPRPDPHLQRNLAPSLARAYLLQNLADRLYRSFFCPGGVTTEGGSADADTQPALGEAPLERKLAVAYSGRKYVAEGWTVERVQEDGWVVVRRGDGLRVWAATGECVAAEGKIELQPGDPVGLVSPCELPAISPGFYMAVGERDFSPARPADLRFYWNPGPESAPRLLSLLTQALNRARVPFRVKLLNDPGLYARRSDAAVLYVRSEDCRELMPLLAGVYEEIGAPLRDATPALAKRLAPGFALAEEPGGMESFGQHRCRVLAEALAAAYDAGVRGPRERVRFVLEALERAGISPQTPYLNAGSEDKYEFEAREARERSNGRKHRKGKGTMPGAYLDVAGQIARRLAREAIWAGELCNWVGAGIEAPEGHSGQTAVVYRALGPNMYEGTAGVGLFLAELAALAGDPVLRSTALGAIRQALSHAEQVEPEMRCGLHNGWAGLAWVATRAGLILNDSRLVEDAVALVKRTSEEVGPRHEFDLVSGSAGGVAGAVLLAEMLGDHGLLEVAKRHAARLVECARREERGWSWPSPGWPSKRNLTGFSHGAAGVGFALLELHGATGEDVYRRAAQQAFEYERAWFDPLRGNWPDFREDPAGRRVTGRRRLPPAFQVSWCHGAPGIALSRIAAARVLDDPVLELEAQKGMDVTEATTKGWLGAQDADFCLCHGMAGNAEVLALSGRGAAAEEIARVGMERLAAGEGRWPLAMGGHESPGLMTGLAGIGYFYLRMGAPGVPSVLLPVAGEPAPYET